MYEISMDEAAFLSAAMSLGADKEPIFLSEIAVRMGREMAPEILGETFKAEGDSLLAAKLVLLSPGLPN